MRSNIDERKYYSYREADSNQTKIAVEVENKSPIIVSQNVIWDEINSVFPSPTQKLFTYLLNSIPVMTVLVTYTSSSRKDILAVVKTIL